MKVTVNAQFVEILPTGKADEPKNYFQPYPLIKHTTFHINEEKVFIINLYHNIHEECYFADFVGDIPYTTPEDIKNYLMSILS